MKSIFITGTGTDIGKSVVTAGILRNLLKMGINTAPMKPVQSGAAVEPDGTLSSPDISLALAASGYCIPENEKFHSCPYIYRAAASPHLAAEIESKPYPDPAVIKKSLEILSNNHDFLIVEGAGGVSVPITDSLTTIDLIKELDTPVLLVAANRLGCINDAINTAYILKNNHIKIAGVVMTNTSPETDENDFIRRDNTVTIEKFTSVKVLGEIKYIDGLNPMENEFWTELDPSFKKICRSLLTGDCNE